VKISDRFTDYGLIGGFFWLLQVALGSFCGIFEPGSNLLRSLKAGLDAIPSGAVASVAALVGALALIAVFATGLVLDLLGSSYYRIMEAGIFVAYIRRNRRWLEDIVNQSRDYMQDDWSVLLNTPAYWRGSFSKEHLLHPFRRGRIRPMYMRMQSFLLSYVLLAPGMDKVELLSTQMALWNLSRAIATAMLVVAVEASLVPLLMITGTVRPAHISVYLSLLQLVSTGVSFGVAYLAYARVCSTLFALTYVISSRAHTHIQLATSTE